VSFTYDENGRVLTRSVDKSALQYPNCNNMDVDFVYGEISLPPDNDNEDPGASYPVERTLTGTAGSDVLEDDIATRSKIVGLEGNDLIRGRGGYDLLLGGAGNDTLYGDYQTYVSGFDFDKSLAVYKVYRAVLGRDPDKTGYVGWARAMGEQGYTEAAVYDAVIASPEFTQKLGNPAVTSNAAFVAHLYNNVLRRPQDQAGYAAWLGHLNNGGSRAAAVQGFYGSAEFQQNAQGWANTYQNSNAYAVDLLMAPYLSNSNRMKGGDGSDTLYGGNGDDYYVYAPGDGSDTIVEIGNLASGGDQIVMTGGIRWEDLRIGRSGSDLVIQVPALGGRPAGKITVKNWTSGGKARIETLTIENVSVHDLGGY
ncbi:DUF4214 domain-containing protein, partial [Pannonibacter tanglangensis]